MFLWPFRKILLLISSEASPRQLAAGVSFGLLLGLVPTANLVWVAVLLLALLLRVNLGMAFAIAALSKILAWPMAPAFIALGEALLRSDALHALGTLFWNTPYVALSGYNRPSVVGGLAMGLALGIPLFPLWVILINKYRVKILPHLEKYWIVRVFKGSVFFKFYNTIAGG